MSLSIERFLYLLAIYSFELKGKMALLSYKVLVHLEAYNLWSSTMAKWFVVYFSDFLWAYETFNLEPHLYQVENTLVSMQVWAHHPYGSQGFFSYIVEETFQVLNS